MMKRRDVLKSFGALASLAVLPKTILATEKIKKRHSFIYCLNMATVRGHNLGFVKELEVAAAAGFTAVEIWIDSLQTYLRNGGTLADAKKRIDDLGLRCEDAIGFAPWIVDDENKRREGLEQLRREMDMLARIGCKRIAAPPAGATTGAALDLSVVAGRYRAALELGDKSGVVPQLEMWGFSKNLSRVSEVMYTALESGHPSAKILLDIFHLYKGGSPLETLHMVDASAIDILHVNDYPANISREKIADADRVHPGDGVAPIVSVLSIFDRQEKPLILSHEVFNKSYYGQDALTVAKTALAKIKAVVNKLD